MAIRGGSTAAANYEEPEWEEAVAKAPSPTQERFVEWITDKAQEDIEASFKGIDLDNAKQAAAFRAGAIMCFRFRMAFQASPENQAAQAAAAKAAAKAAEDEDEKPAKKAKGKKAAPVEEEPAPKAKKGKAAKAKPVEEDDEEEAPKPKAKSAKSKGKRSGASNSAF